MEKPSPTGRAGLLNRRYERALGPIVVRAGQENSRMFEGGRYKGPHQQLLVADEYGGVLIADADCSAGKEAKGHAVIADRLPHPQWDGNALLINCAVFLSTCEQNV